jgi:hypothetical protein
MFIKGEIIMVSTVETSPHCHHAAHCCSPKTPMEQNMETLLHMLEKVSLVALGALSFYTNWQLFLPFFLVGGAIGIYSAMQEKTWTQLSQAAASCTQGVLEQVTGIKLPPIVSLLSNVAITACHVAHHGMVFVPVVAVSIGAYAGKVITHGSNWLYREITALQPPATGTA